MNDGDCYSISNATTIYRYPTITCTEGGSLGNRNNIRRDTFIRGEDGIYRQSQTQSDYDYTPGATQLVTHIWDDSPFLRIPTGDYVLPATLFVICLFVLIIKIFMGVRR